MKTDSQIQKDVIDQLKWDPSVNAAEIGVSVKNGILTLSGIVDSYSKKTAAERAAKSIAGVKAVAEDIQVGVSPIFRKTDAEIAEAILNALRWHTAVNENKIKIKVENGIVTLDGEVDWDYQRKAAKNAIEGLAGIRMINNFITVKPSVNTGDIKQKILAAFQRNAAIDAEKISVDIIGSRVILRGKVRSLAEKEDAALAIWLAPGITQVENNLEVHEEEFAF